MKSKIALFLASMALAMTPFVSAQQTLPVVTTYKSPTCGCCSDWVKHMEENGFTVKVHNAQDMGKYKQMANIPYGAGSCHTSFVGDYAVEGHVPASDVLKMLTEKPDFRGLTVSGMPMGSPGMEYGDRKDPYTTFAYQEDGSIKLFMSH
ncbi:DUF411 domain-containing protein [Endozoicomonas ascidiicola]|uniref:DUF411 domain-containing protein n=1 Tax=Endozoicomonas ascidiicola TaxID=1698521 RepID=UPI00082AB3A0|nr:DUF411 domain-containing protein [Endozoicomonas ascidiicola]